MSGKEWQPFVNECEGEEERGNSRVEREEEEREHGMWKK